MKKMYTFLLLSLFVSAGSMAQTSGGPDDYGYVWRNQLDPNGPTYNWIDISTTGTPITGLADDNSVGPINFGFPFRYYWTDITRFWLGSNGYIAMGGPGQISSQPTIGFPATPTPAAPNNIVAPMLSDLNFTQDAGGAPNPSQAFFWTNNTDTAIITFQNVAFWNDNTDGWSGSNTFQVIFAATDSSITFQYQDQTGHWNASYDATTNPMVIGIENVTGTVGLMVSNNTKPTANTAIKFYYPASTTFTVTDAAVSWNNNDENKGFFALSGVPTEIETNITNVGNTGIAGPIAVSTNVRKAAPGGAPTGPALFTGTESISNLAVGQEENITYTNLFTPPVPPATNANPSYLVTTSLTLTGDLNPSNNQLATEMVVLDTLNKANVTLRYDDGIASTSTTLGFEGGGVYFEPPFYPVILTDLLYNVAVTAGSTGSFVAKVFDNSGPNGSPGAALAAPITVMANDILANAYTTVALPAPVTINSGGFYVSYELVAPTSLQEMRLNVDDTPPFSRQSYEVLFGVFGEYRSADQQDLMIRANITWPGAGTGTFTPGQVSSSLKLSNIYPNPASGIAFVDYSLVEAAPVSFQLTTITGQAVKRVELGVQAQGSQKLQLDVNDLPSGVYFCTMTAGNDVITKKMVIAK